MIFILLMASRFFPPHNRNAKQGFTLLELIVSLSIVLTILLGPVALLIRGLQDSRFARNRLRAILLAQEGIELVRVIRENNKICQVKGNSSHKWDNGLNSGHKQIDAIQKDSTDCNGPLGNLTFQNPRTLGGPCESTPLRMDAQGRYTYDNAGGTIETPFWRCVEVTQDSTDEADAIMHPANPISKEDYIRVSSKVGWRERGVAREIVFSTRLYDWSNTAD
ncbi:MAG: hypothetical protein G01um101466_214 [Parcubacteria group bacterium Gr01-1014_66]|nr:MAG: hypothetical protein G01um101466_214 [Parcubacteria group bacterium Gr01-1014_66]